MSKAVEDLLASIAADDELEHHGVKGQKWGTRHDAGHEGQRATNSKIAKLDKQFDRKRVNLGTTFKVHNKAADLYNNGDLHKINNKPQYKDKDFTKDTPLRRKYYKEHQDAFINNLEKAATSMGTNASGTKQYTILVQPNNERWDIVLKDVKHAADDSPDEFSIEVKLDAMGHITGLGEPTELVHAFIGSVLEAMISGEKLEHYGIPGMHWGKRTGGKGDGKLHIGGPNLSKMAGKAIINKVKSNKAAKTAARPASSEDHTKAQELRHRPVDSLSNKELKDLNQRLQLAKQYKDLTKKKPAFKKGHDYVKEAVAVTATATAIYTFAQSPLGKAVRSSVTEALKKASAAA